MGEKSKFFSKHAVHFHKGASNHNLECQCSNLEYIWTAFFTSDDHSKGASEIRRYKICTALLLNHSIQIWLLKSFTSIWNDRIITIPFLYFKATMDFKNKSTMPDIITIQLLWKAPNLVQFDLNLPITYNAFDWDVIVRPCIPPHSIVTSRYRLMTHIVLLDSYNEDGRALFVIGSLFSYYDIILDRSELWV